MDIAPVFSNFRHLAILAAKRLIYGSRGEPFHIQGHTLRYLPGTRPVRMRYATSTNSNARYDALQVKILSENLREGDTAIDIGAHCGQYSILMAAMCGQTGHVVAFEPDPYAREKLLKNLDLNPGVKRPSVEEAAVSDTAGQALLYSRGGNAQSSFAHSAVESPPGNKSERISVSQIPLDSYLLENNLPEPRWVKIDVEGAEIRILKGARRLLSGDANIICELHPYAWAELGNTFLELRTLAEAAGRRIRCLDQDTEIDEEHVEYCTVLLERRR
jgi:FkbM family methyltransferase